MKKLSMFVLLVGLLSSFCGAAEQSAADKLKVLIKNLHTYQADFSQQVTDAEGEVLQDASGNLALMQPGKLYWQVSEPDESTLIADGDNLWQIDPFMQQVIAMQQQQAISNNPFVLLTDPNTDLWRQYQVSQTANNAQQHTYVIQALSEQSPIVSLSLDFAQGQLVRLVFTDRQQQTSRFEFSNIRQNQSIAESHFAFTLPEGFELDDQRRQ